MGNFTGLAIHGFTIQRVSIVTDDTGNGVISAYTGQTFKNLTNAENLGDILVNSQQLAKAIKDSEIVRKSVDVATVDKVLTMYPHLVKYIGLEQLKVTDRKTSKILENCVIEFDRDKDIAPALLVALMSSYWLFHSHHIQDMYWGWTETKTTRRPTNERIDPKFRNM